jgi:hypothetical protein
MNENNQHGNKKAKKNRLFEQNELLKPKKEKF